MFTMVNECLEHTGLFSATSVRILFHYSGLIFEIVPHLSRNRECTTRMCLFHGGVEDASFKGWDRDCGSLLLNQGCAQLGLVSYTRGWAGRFLY